MRRTLAVLFVALALLACTPVPSPQPPPTPDASDAAPPRAWDAAPVVVIPDGGGDVFDIACLNLTAIGCPEGPDPLCADRMRRAENANHTRYNASCVAIQKTAEQVRNCAPAWKNGCRGARSSP